jgi:hypothetical protein
MLSRIIAPEDVVIDEAKCPVVVVDPRAGQGPGIGGFKAESEIGDALNAGHPVYFIGFSLNPEPGQQFLDVVEGRSNSSSAWWRCTPTHRRRLRSATARPATRH